MVIDTGVCRGIVKQLSHPSSSITAPALRTVGNIVTGDDMQTQHIIAAGGIRPLALLLQSPRHAKEAARALSNIAAESQGQIQAVIDANVVPLVHELMARGEAPVRKEAACVLTNIAISGSPAQVNYIVEQGALRALSERLGDHHADPFMLATMIRALDAILCVGALEAAARGMPANPYAARLDAAGGAEALEALHFHDSREVYEGVLKIMRGYFPKEDGVLAAPTPIANQQVCLSGGPAQLLLRVCMCVCARVFVCDRDGVSCA
jgi:importin subunit alpha-1